MISMDELLMGRAKLEDLSPEIQANLNLLLERINKVRTAWGKPMHVNSGLRLVGQQPANAAAKSNHLVGLAVDIGDDADGTLWQWVLANLQLMQNIGLWFEDPRWTHNMGNWVHFQVVPPKSGKRIYVPSSAPASAPDVWDGQYDKKFDS